MERNLLCSTGGYIAYGVVRDAGLVGDFVVDFGGTFCYAITVADKRFTRDICYKPCLPGCSGGQGELKINSQSQ